ncbi:hypothetical protein Q1695_013576 [Nippostrongylus brasiliensis]|nr:hypothetical protein Q1695_013576 [Nippostrongylus brasiliensis]
MQQVRTITPLQEEKLFVSCDNTQHEPTKSPSKEELGFAARKKVKRESFSPELSSWTDDTKSALINEVMNFPQLWDVNVPSAKAQWKNLRDTFIRKHRDQQVKTRSRAADLPVKWRFYKEMKFLLSNADSGKRLCNVSAEHPGPSKVLREKGQQRSPVTRNTALDSVCDAVDGINDSRKRRDEFDTYGDYVAMMLRSISKSNRPAGIRLRHTITTAIVKCEADILTNEASEDAEESQLNGYHV